MLKAAIHSFSSLKWYQLLKFPFFILIYESVWVNTVWGACGPEEGIWPLGAGAVGGCEAPRVGTRHAECSRTSAEAVCSQALSQPCRPLNVAQSLVSSSSRVQTLILPSCVLTSLSQTLLPSTALCLSPHTSSMSRRDLTASVSGFVPHLKDHIGLKVGRDRDRVKEYTWHESRKGGCLGRGWMEEAGRGIRTEHMYTYGNAVMMAAALLRRVLV